MDNDKILMGISENMGFLKGTVKSIEDKLTSYHTENETQHKAMWSKIDRNYEDIKSNSKFKHKILGAFIVVSAVWASIIAWIRHHISSGN